MTWRQVIVGTDLMQAKPDSGSSGLHSKHTRDDLNATLGIIDTHSRYYILVMPFVSGSCKFKHKSLQMH